MDAAKRISSAPPWRNMPKLDAHRLGLIRINQNGWSVARDSSLIDDDFGNVLHRRQIEHDLEQGVLNDRA